MPDVTGMLEHDHREVEQLFSRYLDSGDPSLAERICTELTVHTEVEEKHVYPALRQAVPGGADLAREAQHEHDEVASMIEQARREGFSSWGTRATMERMRQAVAHHVAEEESDLLPRLRSCCGGSQLERMGEQVQQAKQQLMSTGSTGPTGSWGSTGSSGSDGPGTAGRLIDLTKDELYAKAKEAGIEGRSSMNKKELAEALERR